MISTIHNVYERNQYIRESVILNIKALEESKLEYQYIIFNDKGDSSIYEDIKDVLSNKVEYFYSDYNYGMGVCSGGWVGAIPLLKGDYVHNIGQDDVFTSLFYKSLINKLKDPDVYLAYANGIMTDESLSSIGNLLGPLQNVDYSHPRKIFYSWFSYKNGKLMGANNYIPAPGAIYKIELHTKIGIPDLTFKGSADFEYWSRILFNNLKVVYDPRILWLYRRSKHSLADKPTANTKEWNDLILQKFQSLLDNE